MNKMWTRHSFQDVYDNNNRKIRMVKRLAKLYKPYVYFKFVYVILRPLTIMKFYLPHYNSLHNHETLDYFSFQL